MKTCQSSPWINLHTYFKLALLRSNFLILILFVIITASTLLLTFPFILTFISYGFACLLLCNQFIKNAISNFNQFLFNKKISLTLQLSVFCIWLLYPFYYFDNSVFSITVYSLFFMLLSPAIISCLLMQGKLLIAINPVVFLCFIAKNLSGYLFCLTAIILMGLGYKTSRYYTTLWLPTEVASIVSLGLGAYLFLVSAYVLSDLIDTNALNKSDTDSQDFIYLKNYITTSQHDQIHDFFKPENIHIRSIALLDFYLKFLLTTQDDKKIGTFGTRWINQLFLQNNIKKAVSVFELIFKKNPYFRLSEPLINFMLAKQFLLSKQPLIVINLLKELPEKCPDFTYLPEVFLMLAKAYIELNLEIKARQAIEIITQHFPDSKYYSEAIALKKILHTSASGWQPPKG